MKLSKGKGPKGGKGEKGRKGAHAALADDMDIDEPPEVCSHFEKKGTCYFGDECKFQHNTKNDKEDE